MIKKNSLPVFLFLLFLNTLEAQVKYDREYRMSKEDVPQAALDFVREIDLTSKVKWYKEEGPDGDSVEAKTKIKSRKYNIDFDGEGLIEDIEVDIKPRELDPILHKKIKAYLDSNYQKPKICKAQIQVVGSRENLIKVLNYPESKENLNLITRYELEVTIKDQRRHHKMEFLFDPNGVLIRKTRIITKNTDNLDY